MGRKKVKEVVKEIDTNLDENSVKVEQVNLNETLKETNGKYESSELNNFGENIEVEKSSKEEKKKRFFDEIKSFIILVIIIGVVILAGWLFYKYAKPFNKEPKVENKVVETNDYTYVTYNVTSDDNRLEFIGNNYLIEYNGDELVKIMDKYSNVLYEAINIENYSFIEGIDGNLYAIEYLDIDDENLFNLYVLENSKLVQVSEFIDENTYYSLIIYKYFDNFNYSYLISSGGTEKLIGVYSNTEYMDGDLNEIREEVIYTLDNKEYELEDVHLDCDIVRENDDAPFYTASERYIVVKNDKSQYGLYDLQEGKVIIEPDYEGLYTANDGNYVAIKNGKAGIINKKLKKLVDFEYDFIDINDGYYIVSKNSKLAVMNSDFKLVTGFDFDYQSLGEEYSYRCLDSINSFLVLKLDDRYVLTINNGELDSDLDVNYNKSETYIINSDGTYKTIKANEFDFSDDYAYAYLKDEKKYQLYDTENFEIISTIDLSDYDYDNYPSASIIGDVICIDLDSELYFAISTGEDLEVLMTHQVIINGDMKIDIDMSNYNVTLTAYDKELETIGIDITDLDYNVLEDEASYFITSTNYVLVEKKAN